MNRILTLILLAVLTGCNGAPSPSGVVSQFGTYPSPDKRHSLVVSKQQTSIIAFTVSAVADGRVLHSDQIGSDAQRWCFFWDEQSRLWAYSSDTGYFAVFTIQPDGTVSKSNVDKSTPMPKPVYEFLPSSLKRIWGI